MKKLSVIRHNSCPFGLPVPYGCKNAGKLIKTLKPLNNGGDIDINNNKLKDFNDKEKCFYASDIIKDEFVNCDAPDNLNEKEFPIGSPKYYKPMAGIGLEGLDTLPLGYYNDNSLDRGYYYGMYSIESISSQKEQPIKSHYNSNSTAEENISMSLDKKAQSADLDGFYVSPEELEKFLQEDTGDLKLELEVLPENEEEKVLLKESNPEIHGHVEMVLEEPSKEDFNIELPFVPGADDQTEIEEPEILEVKDDEDVEVEEDDPWKWSVKSFLSWIKGKLNNVPRHSGKDIVGVERAISYLERCGKECSKAARLDIDNEIDADALEKIRDQIYQGIERLEERLDKLKSVKHPKKTKKKRADEENGLVKEARMPEFQVVVPLFISHIARTIINSSVSAGHDAEDIYRKLVKKYKLDRREQAEIVQLLEDMGFITWTDRLYARDEEGIDPRSEDNGDWSPNRYN